MDSRGMPVIYENGYDNPSYEMEEPSPSFKFTGRRRSSAFSITEADVPQIKMLQRRKSEVITSKELIISMKQQILQPSDFSTEIRCKRDIDLFVSDARIILDCEENSLEDIIHEILIKILGDSDIIERIEETLFAHESAYFFANTVQGITFENGQYTYDQSWICAHCQFPSISRRYVTIVRMKNPTHFGVTAHDVQFLILILTPNNEKHTKSPENVSRTFATLFSDFTLRLALLTADNESQFADIILKRAENFSKKSNLTMNDYQMKVQQQNEETEKFRITFGRGLIENVKRRAKYYVSDYIDGVNEYKSLYKTTATFAFLYFACILPCIAFGVLDFENTGLIDTRRAIIGQAIGGMFFALFSGQPLVIIMTTAPLCLYTKVVYDIAKNLEVEFYDMFACVGLWNSFFVIIYALFDVSVVMKWCTRSTEEIFAIFIFFAFSVDAIKDCVKNFHTYYCINGVNSSDLNISLTNITESSPTECSQQNSILFLFLMLATVWAALTLYNLNYTPYLSKLKREILADYALPIAVIGFSFVGTFLFRDIKVNRFEFGKSYEFDAASFNSLTVGAIFAGAGLGFALSLLFFMDQNISAALVNNPNNNLKKGSAYHWDLLIVAVLNAFLSIFGLPWMHGILPHSPLHARSLADVEQRTVDGHVKEVVVYVRETRVAAILTHGLIALSLLMIEHPLDYIPISVLNGLFLYCAFATLRGNSFYERIMLFITEQNSYPPNHYIRRCPQRKIHSFTCAQLIQLLILCFFGFAPWPYVQMIFPIIIAIFIPIRWKMLPLFIEEKYLNAIDGYM